MTGGDAENIQHPAFPQPAHTGVTLWRYLDAAKFEWLLDCQRLYMPSADRLGDPREGSTPNFQVEWWRREAVNAATEESRRIVEHNREFMSQMVRKHRDHYFVSCWHLNEHENHAMWACYTSSPEAVALKCSYEALRSALPSHVEMGVVRYIDYAAERLPTMNLLEHIMHKDIYFSFEREVRAVTCPLLAFARGEQQFRQNLFEKEGAPGVRVYAPPVDAAHLIKGVVLHPDAPAAFCERVEKQCAKHDLPQPQRSRCQREVTF